ICGVSAARVSQWLSDGKLTGEAIVGHGLRARIRVDVARAQLKRRLDVNQRASEEAALRAGVYVKVADVQQQFGALAARLMSAFEASFMPIANAIVAAHAQTP